MKVSWVDVINQHCSRACIMCSTQEEKRHILEFLKNCSFFDSITESSFAGPRTLYIFLEIKGRAKIKRAGRSVNNGQWAIFVEALTDLS